MTFDDFSVIIPRKDKGLENKEEFRSHLIARVNRVNILSALLGVLGAYGFFLYVFFILEVKGY